MNKIRRVQGDEWKRIKNQYKLIKIRILRTGNILAFLENKKDPYIQITHFLGDVEIKRFKKNKRVYVKWLKHSFNIEHKGKYLETLQEEISTYGGL